MTKLWRWSGIVDVVEGPSIDETPLCGSEDDPFVVRFRVKPVVILALCAGGGSVPKFMMTCANQNKEVVVRGMAVVKKLKEVYQPAPAAA